MSEKGVGQLATSLLRPWRLRWRRTQPCKSWILKVGLLKEKCQNASLGLFTFVVVVFYFTWFESRHHMWSDCKVGDAGAVALAAALEKNTTLQELNLNGAFVEGMHHWVFLHLWWSLYLIEITYVIRLRCQWQSSCCIGVCVEEEHDLTEVGLHTQAARSSLFRFQR